MLIHGYTVTPTNWKLIWPEPEVTPEVNKVEATPVATGFLSTFLNLFRTTRMGEVVPEQPPILPQLDLNSVTIQCSGLEFDTIGKLYDVIVEGHAFIGIWAMSKSPVDWTTGLMTVVCKCSDYFELSEEELERVLP
jgi:hypothetical protein